jgi:hypothetical protein
LGTEDHLSCRAGLDALLGNGRAVSVAAHVPQHLRVGAQRGFGLDHPVFAPQRLALLGGSWPPIAAVFYGSLGQVWINEHDTGLKVNFSGTTWDPPSQLAMTG